MHDELTALQLELLKIDEKVVNLQEENRRLSTVSADKDFDFKPSGPPQIEIRCPTKIVAKFVHLSLLILILCLSARGRKEGTD